VSPLQELWARVEAAERNWLTAELDRIDRGVRRLEDEARASGAMRGEFEVRLRYVRGTSGLQPFLA
jgi:hypothetical protein